MFSDFPQLLCGASLFVELRLSWSFTFRGAGLDRGVSPFVDFFFVGVSPFVELGFLVVFRLLCRFRRNRSRRVS